MPASRRRRHDSTTPSTTIASASTVESRSLVILDHRIPRSAYCRLEDVIDRVKCCMLRGCRHLFSFESLVQLMGLLVFAGFLAERGRQVRFVHLELVFFHLHFYEPLVGEPTALEGAWVPVNLWVRLSISELASLMILSISMFRLEYLSVRLLARYS